MFSMGFFPTKRNNKHLPHLSEELKATVYVLYIYQPRNFYCLLGFPKKEEYGHFNLFSKCLLVFQIDDLSICLDFTWTPLAHFIPLSVQLKLLVVRCFVPGKVSLHPLSLSLVIYISPYFLSENPDHSWSITSEIPAIHHFAINLHRSVATLEK